MQTAVHDCFARLHSSTLETRLGYSPRDAFYTFPFPLNTSTLESIGLEHHEYRSRLLQARTIGLTKLYNLFHDEKISDEDIGSLRDLHIKLDTSVISAYGWSDINLGHGFHEATYLPGSDRTRFTISEPARVEVLRRLSDLNLRRYEEELAKGLQGGASPRSTSRKPSKQRTTSADFAQPEFDFAGALPSFSHISDPAASVLDFLATHRGWHAKAEILTGTGTAEVKWKATIDHLIAAGKVEREGEKRGVRYRIQPEDTA